MYICTSNLYTKSLSEINTYRNAITRLNTTHILFSVNSTKLAIIKLLLRGMGCLLQHPHPAEVSASEPALC